MTGNNRQPAAGGHTPALPGFSTPQDDLHRYDSTASPFAGYDTISLGELNQVALLDRVEVKYLLPAGWLPLVLAHARSDYRVLTIKGQHSNHYRTLYFDTPDLAMYQRHHMGARNRYKVRARQYVESCYSFLEVKHKTNRAHTVKSRLPTDVLVTNMNQSSVHFLRDKCPYNGLELAPCLWNTYTCVTLVSKTRW